ncbi:Na/Pi cotransporter family protein [Marinomonas agarivorans]|nr:Na/Pi cotransporter family protein [Marinomonas agarivorans]
MHYSLNPLHKKTGLQSLNWLLVLIVIYLLICAIALLSSNFKAESTSYAADLFHFANNPFSGLVIGIIATASVQSSSTVTSIIVGLVAGGLPIDIAIPIVMGANVGTSITNTMVALGHIQAREKFRRAFAAATLHDFFNLLSVIIFLPLEIAFGLLENISRWITSWFYNIGNLSLQELNIIKVITNPTVELIQYSTSYLGEFDNIAAIIIGTTLLFLTINSMSKLLKVLLIGKAKNIIHTALGHSPMTGIASGTLITAMVQSSSTTTSLLIPLASSGTFKLKEIYPFTLGANIGTCITAVLSATAVVGNAYAALQIALIHLLYNILGVLVIYGVPVLRKLPLKMAERFGEIAEENKFIALIYISGIFFLLPILLLSLNNVFFGQ